MTFRKGDVVRCVNTNNIPNPLLMDMYAHRRGVGHTGTIYVISDKVVYIREEADTIEIDRYKLESVGGYYYIYTAYSFDELMTVDEYLALTTAKTVESASISPQEHLRELHNWLKVSDD